MIGTPYVKRWVPISELGPAWTREEVREVLDLALRGEDESKGLVKLWIDSAHRPVIENILGFCGDNPNVTCGSMGEPNIVSEVTYILREVFEDTMIDALKYYWHGAPFSDRELRQMCFLDYIWTGAVDK